MRWYAVINAISEDSKVQLTEIQDDVSLDILEYVYWRFFFEDVYVLLEDRQYLVLEQDFVSALHFDGQRYPSDTWDLVRQVLHTFEGR